MNFIWFALSFLIQTLLRLLPVPSKTGLVKIGNPGKDSPVFLTCNYHLTVQRLKRVLRGSDAYLLIVNSRGINVWCASEGGHFTNHDVIAVLKTSGIEQLVGRKEVILPQLAAAGVEAKVIEEKTGWRVIWGPIYAKDIPHFLEKNRKKDPIMREVQFPWTQRLEMAIAWAFPISVILSFILIFVWPKAIFPAILLIWGLSLLIFLSFPVYSSLLISKKKRRSSFFFDYDRWALPLVLWGIVLLCLLFYSILSHHFSWIFSLRWGILSLIVVLLLNIDLKGSTPVHKSPWHEERLISVFLEKKKCRGVGFCEDVCPRNCFMVDREKKKTTMPGARRCINCGACIVQCPHDALRFKNLEGEEISPESIRRLKLNLWGKRIKKTK